MTAAMTEPQIYRESFFTAPDFAKSGTPWLRDIRQKSWQRFREIGFPTRKLEAWKYLNLEALLNQSFLPATTDRCGFVALSDLNQYFFSHKETNRIVYFNGRNCRNFCSGFDLPPGAFLKPLSEVLRDAPGWLKQYWQERAGREEDGFAAVNAFNFHEGIVLYVPKDTKVEAPVHLLFAGGAESEWPSVFYPRIVICLEAGAKAEIVFESVGIKNEAYFMNSVFDIILGENANLNWINIREQSEKSHQFFFANVRQAKASHLEMVTFSQESGIVRDEMKIDFTGTEASCSLSGLSILSHSNQVFQHMHVEHEKPSCTSRQFFKNILAGRAQAEFDSLVHVKRDAQKSDSYQLNKNLLLSESARAYARPQLKIDADDVQCAHGSATGQLDKGELFYLQSRGLRKEVARFVLTYGFAEEILQGIPVAPLRHKLELAVKAKLESIAFGHALEEGKK